MSARVGDGINGVYPSTDRLAVRVEQFLDNNSIAHTRAAWTAAVNGFTQAQLNAALRVLLIELFVFDGDTDPV